MIWVTEVKALPDYRLWVRFSDGSQGNGYRGPVGDQHIRRATTSRRGFDQPVLSQFEKGNDLLSLDAGKALEKIVD